MKKNVWWVTETEINHAFRWPGKEGGVKGISGCPFMHKNNYYNS